MNGQDNPFGALDKLLFAPTQTKAKEKKQVSDEAKGQPKQDSPTPFEKKRPTLTTQSSTAKLQSRKVSKVQERGAAKTQTRKNAKMRNSENAASQIRKGAKSQNRKTAKVQETVRKGINHGLSIYEDQLLSLKEIQLERQRVLGEKYSLGDLTKEALDMFIIKERSKK